MRNHIRSTVKARNVFLILLLALSITASAQAQKTAFETSNGSDAGGTPISTPRFNFWLRPAAFSLRPTASIRGNARPRPIKTTMLVMAGGPNLPVFGGGTIGRLTKWTGFSVSSFIGDSTIFEDKLGNVGVGTDAPASRLTVVGTIETTLGGLKFPDGTLQSTAAVTGLQAIVHNDTLKGDGTNGSPLQISVPLQLFGATSGSPIISVSNFFGGLGFEARGGSSPNDDFNGKGGTGVRSVGGRSDKGQSGPGLESLGGDGISAGLGIRSVGGRADTNGIGGAGVLAFGGLGTGPFGRSGDGIVAIAGGTLDGADTGRAGTFDGDVQIDGTLNVSGTKNFKIDHPLDPENRYLLHAAVESSEVLNIYCGNVITDGLAEATVALPEWFEAINRDFRYQLTVIGGFAQAIIGSEISQNRFTIRTSAPNVKVSWQVIGLRSDAVMLKHPFSAEQDKPRYERGTYASPEAYGQPEERGAEWARHHELMRQAKQTREGGRQ